jgi:hypothetical protein
MPVYPKESPEYRQKILKSFYKQVQETNWGVPEERICKRRGRRPQERVIVQREIKPKVKFFNFH